MGIPGMITKNRPARSKSFCASVYISYSPVNLTWGFIAYHEEVADEEII